MPYLPNVPRGSAARRTALDEDREGDAQDSTFITYADADLANDLSTRRSVSGYCTDQPNAFHTFTGIEFIWVK